MKKLALLLAWMAVVPCVTYAQDDDVYFIPSEDVTPVDDHASSYTPLTVDAADEAADNAGADYYSDSQIDAYNRRGNGTDTVQYGDYEADTSAQTEGSMTERLIRFHSPEINVYVSSPYYWDYYYDPVWWYSPGWAPCYSWSWGWAWAGPFWSWSWRWGWYDPFWGPTWGWGGWYDHWGEAHNGRSPEEFRRAFEALIQTGASFNLYMFHGGTNFGFMNGANHTDNKFQPDVTSYDYDCMLTEQGEPTEKYWIVRELCEKYTGKKAPELTLPANPAAAYGKVALTAYGSVFDQLNVMASRHHTMETRPMEYYGQNYGYILYRTTLPCYGEQELRVNNPHDLAYIFINGKYIDRIWRNDASKMRKVNFDLEENRLDILVENFGRVNYGSFLHDHKGITENVTIGMKLLMDWDVFCMELDDPQHAVLFEALPEKTAVHGFLRGSFSADELHDTFLSTKNLSVGQVFVNGFNLGRYWTEAGPQQTLYVPAPLLRKGENELLIFENEGVRDFSVELIDHAELS